MKNIILPAMILLLMSTTACLPIRDKSKLEGELIRNNALIQDGLSRQYHLYVPDELPADNIPLVILFHGHLGSADQVIGENDKPAPFRQWLHIADRDKFIVLIPNGERGSDDERGWNDCRADADTNPTTDDVAFVRSLIDTVQQNHAINPDRIYANGISNGGMMALRLALEVSDRFAAVAAVVASMAADSECAPLNNPVSVLLMNGTDDPFLPYEGGAVSRENSNRGTVIATNQAIDYWRDYNNITAAASEHEFNNRSVTDGSTVKRFIYDGGTNDSAVALFKVNGGGHVEPSIKHQFSAAYELLVGRQNHDIEMAEEVWDFVKSRSRSAP